MSFLTNLLVVIVISVVGEVFKAVQVSYKAGNNLELLRSNVLRSTLKSYLDY